MDGVLVEMSLGTGKHSGIIRKLSRWLEDAALDMGQEWVVLSALVSVQTQTRSGISRARIPDVVILPASQWDGIQGRSGMAIGRVDESVLLLVIEVVSPSTKSEDYGDKQDEYAARGIPEFWIVDLTQAGVWVLVLAGNVYQRHRFENQDLIRSPTFPSLDLTAAQVLRAGRSGPAPFPDRRIEGDRRLLTQGCGQRCF